MRAASVPANYTVEHCLKDWLDTLNPQAEGTVTGAATRSVMPISPRTRVLLRGGAVSLTSSIGNWAFPPVRTRGLGWPDPVVTRLTDDQVTADVHTMTAGTHRRACRGLPPLPDGYASVKAMAQLRQAGADDHI